MRRGLFVLLTLMGIAIFMVLLITGSQSPAVGAEVVNLQNLKSNAGFALASEVRPFSFPRDHGPHPEFQTEWWYYTGNLETRDGRHFGYQLTFFRRAVTPSVSPRTSDWATNQIYLAHFAITDVKSNTHTVAERYSRGAAGLAGATGNPYHVWIDNWAVSSLNPEGSQVQLTAEDSGRSIGLILTADKPPVFHGDAGLSPKSDQPGDASYYYSYTRLETEGKITLANETFNVRGLSWMDHEFGTTELGPEAVGWDWFSVQLRDRREIMYFQIRRRDGSVDRVSGGTLVEPDGTVRHLSSDAVTVQASAAWTSPESRAPYPARWKISVPAAKMELTLQPYVADQEMRLEIVYWEGAVEISGRSNGAAIDGSGYVEMTGYAPLAK